MEWPYVKLCQAATPCHRHGNKLRDAIAGDKHLHFRLHK